MKLRAAVSRPTSPTPASGPMTVSALARRVGITAEAVRYYVRTGLLHPARNADNGYRQFGAEELRRLRFIRQAQSLGFSLADIGTILQQANRKQSPCPLVREIIQRRIEQAGEQLEQLIALRDRMRSALHKWSTMPDAMPNGHAICRLIECVDPEPEGNGAVGRNGGARTAVGAKEHRRGVSRPVR